MNIGDFLHSKRWKLMQNYIYSWGAAVVLIGALFKLQHLPGASVFLGVGLSIEAIIFFVSAFEPLMETPDWKIIYPQLRNGTEGERQLKIYEQQDKIYPPSLGGGASGNGGGNGIAFNDLPEDQLKSLNESFDKLAKAAKGIQDISQATSATSVFVKNLNDASASIGAVVDANRKVSLSMDSSVKEISESYKDAAQTMHTSSQKAAVGIDNSLNELSETVTKTTQGLGSVTQKMSSGVDKTAKILEDSGNEFAKKLDHSAAELNTSYKEMTDSMSKGFKGLEKSSETYTTNLDKLNKNLGAINAAYELHLKGTSKVESSVREYSKGVDQLGQLIHTSVEETRKFNQNTKEISGNIQALNTIYGNMLGALNGKK
jgi:gliding motility-associated protein GldL